MNQKWSTYFSIRHNLVNTPASAQSLPAGLIRTEHAYSIKDGDSLKLHIFVKQKIQDEISPAILIFHGGGWSSGSPEWAFGLAQRFAEKGIRAVAVQYRLSNQKDISPVEAMTDAKDAVIWVKNNSEELHISSEKLAVYGWSAGAHLAAGTAVFPKFESGVSSIPSAMILSSPALSTVNDQWFNRLIPAGKEAIDFSPAENISAKLPASIILVGREDQVTPVTQARLFYNKAIEHGSDSRLHIHENVGHLYTPADASGNGRPEPDKETMKKVLKSIDAFLMENNFILEVEKPDQE